MNKQRVISKASLAVIKASLARLYTRSEMENTFEEYGFELRDSATPSNKLEVASTHLDHQDWTDPAAATRLLRLIEQRFSQSRVFPDTLESSDASQRIIRSLRERDGIEWDGTRFVQRNAAALIHAAEKSAEFNLDSLGAEIKRILASVNSDPGDSITASKSLVEATCRAVLADFGEDPATGVELGPLVKSTLKQLQLLPEQIPEATRGADAARKVLHSLGTAVQGLGELRNLYGDAHGKGPGAKGLEPRHARLAATCAAAIATFLLETHEQRKEKQAN